MISIQFADKFITVATNCTLAELLQTTLTNNKGYAIALNQQFIPKAHYATTLLQENDVVDMIIPMQGG